MELFHGLNIRQTFVTSLCPTIIYNILILMLQCLLVSPVIGADEVNSSQVLTKVKEVDILVERMRHHMGARRATPLNLKIINAQSHDVFFQARTLFHNSNQLRFQVTRSKSDGPDTPDRIYHLVDVVELTTRVQKNLTAVLVELGLPVSVDVKVDEPYDSTPSDLFIAILDVNRQLNLLLERPFSSSDAYMQVTQAIGYSARQLARFPEVQRIPVAQKVEPGRVPSDVYLQLLDGLERIKKIYQIQGLSSFSVEAEALKREELLSSDVFDIASLLVARLDYLHKYNKVETLPRKPFYPGKVYPTDVYRQTGILLSQLDSLIELYSQTAAD
jgi:hypothetical protein